MNGKRYRKKPVIIEAIEWTGSNYGDIEIFVSPRYGSSVPKNVIYGVEFLSCRDGDIFISTLEGEMKASKGDMIIRGTHHEYYPCKPDIFKEIYEEVK